MSFDSSPVQEPATADSGSDHCPAPELTEFLLELGGMLTGSGDAIADIEWRLKRIAARWGDPDIQVTVLPRAITIAPEPGGPARLVVHAPDELRPEQTTAVFDVARDVERHDVDPAEGLRRLEAIAATEESPSRRLGMIAGQVLMTLAIALIMRPFDTLLGLTLVLGLLVALLYDLSPRLPGFSALLPVAAAMAVAAIAFQFSGDEYDVASVEALIPPLVLLLPGGLLTMATIDLAAGEVVTGASRFVAGVMQLALMAFGLFAGAALVGVEPGMEMVGAEADQWVTWLGVLVFGAAVTVMRPVSMRAMPWLLLVLLAAFAGQLVGEALFGARLSGFFGGLVAVPLALALERFRSAPPAFVTFLPAFWLLVPTGLEGIASIVTDGALGVAALVDAMAAIIAIALGILVGLEIFRIVVAGKRRAFGGRRSFR